MRFSYDYELQTKSLDYLSVDWKSGNIELIPTEVPQPQVGEGEEPPEFTIKIHEQSSRELSEDEQAQAVLKSGGLQVNWKKTAKLFSFLSFDLDFNARRKNIQIEIPKYVYDSMKRISCESVSASIQMYNLSPEKLELETVSGNIHLSGMKSKMVDLSTVSGEIYVEGLNADEAEISSTSGAITAKEMSVNTLNAEGVSSALWFQGSMKEIDVSSVSGDIQVQSEECPEEGNFETVSGEISLYIPQNSEFTALYESISGRFNSSFSGSYEDDEFVVGNGSADLDFSTTSGAMSVHPLLG